MSLSHGARLIAVNTMVPVTPSIEPMVWSQTIVTAHSLTIERGTRMILYYFLYARRAEVNQPSCSDSFQLWECPTIDWRGVSNTSRLRASSSWADLFAGMESDAAVDNNSYWTLIKVGLPLDWTIACLCMCSTYISSREERKRAIHPIIGFF